ncbi:MAG TPA: diacylglycerol kinase family protein [Actinomycetota bacterium]
MSRSPFGTLAVIADPTAGRGSVAAQIPAVRAALERLGLDHRVSIVEGRADAATLTTAALDDGVRYVAAVGDDATVQRVISGLFREGKPIVEDPVLAVVPAGADCDLVRSFGLPTDVDAAASHLLGDTVYPFDVMKIAVTDPDGARVIRYAANVAEVGLHAAAWRDASALPRAMGGARRFLGFWKAYLTNGRRALQVGTDTKTHDLRGWSVVVGNGQFAEGGLRLSPRSFPGDGILDALVFVGPKSDAYRLLPRIFRHGDHVPDPGIRELRARLKVSVEADRPMPVVADGELIGRTPVTFQLIPQPIRLKL